ncbi:MAG: 50S ribosomal protein L1 [Rhodobacteraceae bacterium]|nr:50S ribosomal protein L1 [Paracoccaceae bacterium]
MARPGKRIRDARQKVSELKRCSIEDAVVHIKNMPKTKFDETLDIAINLNVDPRHADQMVRGTVNLPSGTGKKVRVAVFARGAKADEAKDAGADIVGAEELAETIQAGTIEFDRCIATPDLMPLVGRLGKILGPRNLMPNPRVGTVTPNVSEAIANAKGGEVQFRVDKTGTVHGGIGKISFEPEQLTANAKAFVDAVTKAKPTGAKGKYFKKISLSSSMGPSVDVDFASTGGNL